MHSTSSPSYERRMALRKADESRLKTSSFVVSDRFPIEIYYNAVDRLFAAFGEAVRECRLDDAYVLGLRFCMFSIDQLPKHSHCRGKKYRNLTARVEEVLKKLEFVAQLMDAEETVKKQDQQSITRENAQLKQRHEDDDEPEKKKASSGQHEPRQEEGTKRNRQQEQREQEGGDEKTRERQRRELRKLNDVTVKDTAGMGKSIRQEQQEDSCQEATAEKSGLDRRDVDIPVKEQQTQTQQLSTDHPPQTLKEGDTFKGPKMSGQTAEESGTIDVLLETITLQEERIEEIQTVKIPACIQDAKMEVSNKNRKEALFSLYQKRKWEAVLDALQEGVFEMETLLLRLLSAVEDREIDKVMKSAEETMDSLQQLDHNEVSDSTMDEIHRSMTEFLAYLNDDEELRRELEEIVGHEESPRSVPNKC